MAISASLGGITRPGSLGIISASPELVSVSGDPVEVVIRSSHPFEIPQRYYRIVIPQ